ncbi:MAG TPA: ABC transporter permease [Cyclobacteriaceae bacterium]|nr:ABC transporter permease [Cyclobacteriaceae bacterium]
MFRNYIKVSIRNLIKQKLYSVINIGGLAVGIACFIMILIFVRHEFSYDRFYKDSDRIYRVYQRQEGNVFLGSDYFAVTPVRLATVMMDELPEVTYATTIMQSYALLGFGEKNFWEQCVLADERFFDVFAYPFVSGDPASALKDPKSVVLTMSLAKKIFGDQEPLGETLKYQNGELYKVTGIIYDPPVTASIRFSSIVNIHALSKYVDEINRTTWRNNSFYTFFKLAQGASPAVLEQKFPALLKKYRDPEAYKDYPFRDHYFVQEISRLHLQSGINMDIGLKGNSVYVYLFSAIAFIVLLLACINYMNLAVARSVNRSREIGLRKVIGALRSQLVRQFLGESVFVAFLSLLLALALVYLLLPVFGRLIERPLGLNPFENKFLLPGLFALVAVVGLFSGSYPALFMSSMSPIQVLKGKADAKLSGLRIQRWLIVGQFAVSILLIISSLTIWRQLRFMQDKEPGYNKDNIVTVRIRDWSLRSKYETMRNEWLQDPDIIAVTASTALPTNITSSTIINDDPGGSREDDLAIYECGADYDFLNVFGIELAAGRNLSPDIASDSLTDYLINEAAAKALGWTPEEAIGKQFKEYGKDYTIIGVVRDFHMHSMHLPIQPLRIGWEKYWATYLSFKIRPGHIPESIAYMEKILRKYSPYPFEYEFLEDNYNQLYKSEMKLGEIFGFFTILSILIASMGLFGLAAFTAGQRTKEIGIRKVMGASVKNIVILLSRDFLGLITLSFIITIPIAWYLMNKWLQDFAYRIDMEWWMFGIAGLLVILVANLTISYQSIRAAMMNPVDSLRME